MGCVAWRAGQASGMCPVPPTGPDKLLHNLPQPAGAQATSTPLDSTDPIAISCDAPNAVADASSRVGRQAGKATTSIHIHSYRGASHGDLPSNVQNGPAAGSQSVASGADYGQALASSRQGKLSALASAADATPADHAASLARSNAAADALMRQDMKE